jgi:hypothetical protein
LIGDHADKSSKAISNIVCPYIQKIIAAGKLKDLN